MRGANSKGKNPPAAGGWPAQTRTTSPEEGPQKKIYPERSWNVYENKENSGKLTDEETDICAWSNDFGVA